MSRELQGEAATAERARAAACSLRLRQVRERAGFATAKDAAAALDVPTATYTQHESNLRGFPLDRVILYARMFGVNPAWLLFGDEVGAAPPPPAIAAPPKPSPVNPRAIAAAAARAARGAVLQALAESPTA